MIAGTLAGAPLAVLTVGGAAAVMAAFAVVAAALMVGLAAAVGFVSGRRSTAAERARLRYVAHRDPLTGLLNRTGFDVEASAALAGVPGVVPGGTLLVVDLDRFKGINDRLGHRAGDVLLRQVGEVLGRYAAERGGVAARRGGDEFAVLLSSGTDADVAAREVHQLLDRSWVLSASGGPRRIPSAASVGAVEVPPAEPATGPPSSLGQLLHRADSAMYAAKRSRSGWALHSAGTGRDPAGSGTADDGLDAPASGRSALSDPARAARPSHLPRGGAVRQRDVA